MNNSLRSLTPGTLLVWRVPLTQSDDVICVQEGHLSAEEAQHADRYRRERDRCRYVVAHGALRELLAEYTGGTPRDVSFDRTATGKPFLKGKGSKQLLCFNLSHSSDWAVVALALSTEVGIDIEQIDSDVSVEAVAKRFFSNNEFEALRVVPLGQRTDAFFAAWARKEAYLKARGDGIAHRLRRFDVSIDPAPQRLLLEDTVDPCAPDCWRIYDLDIAPGYHAAVAAQGTKHWIRVMDWTYCER